MTKRLTPEEDAHALNEIGYGNTAGRSCGSDDNGSVVIQIDKSRQEFEITREGERFLEVRFKRRESADAITNPHLTDKALLNLSQLNIDAQRESADAGKVVAFDELAPWPDGEQVARLAGRLARADNRAYWNFRRLANGR